MSYGTYSLYCAFQLCYEWMKVVQIFGLNIQFDPAKCSNILAVPSIMDYYILNKKCDNEEKADTKNMHDAILK